MSHRKCTHFDSKELCACLTNYSEVDFTQLIEKLRMGLGMRLDSTYYGVQVFVRVCAQEDITSLQKSMYEARFWNPEAAGYN